MVLMAVAISVVNLITAKWVSLSTVLLFQIGLSPTCRTGVNLLKIRRAEVYKFQFERGAGGQPVGAGRPAFIWFATAVIAETPLVPPSLWAASIKK